MKRIRSCQSLLLMSLLGFGVLVIGCVTTVISPEPYQCPELTEAILDEYEALMGADVADQLRAYVREADRACRANSQLLKDTD